MPENIRVAEEKCDACGACLQACPFFAIDVDAKAVIAESCVECGICVPACPTGAIVLSGGGSDGPARGGVWVYLPGGASGLGALTAARGLADELGAPVAAVVGVDTRADAVDEGQSRLPSPDAIEEGQSRSPSPDANDEGRVFAAGADEVILLKGKGSPHSLLAEAVRREAPAAVLGFAAGSAGSTLARTAAALGLGFVAGATEISVSFSGPTPEFTRPTYGGRFLARLAAVQKGRTIVASLDVRAFRRERRDGPRCGRSRVLELSGAPDPVEVLGEREGRRKVDLQRARVVIAGGLGLGSSGNFAKLYILAEELGALVGADRGAVEAGWAAREQLIDIAGASVAPDLYLAFGVDGTPTHNAAVERSKIIAVVTANRQANILGMADFVLPFDPAEVIEAAIASESLFIG